MPITNKTRSLLEAVGWFPDRRVDVTDAVTAVKLEGYSVSEVALDFLERFGGLYVEEPHPRFRSRLLFEIRPGAAMGQLDREEILQVEEQLGEALTPVGSYQQCYALFMGTSGSVYGVYDEVLARFGRDCEEAMNTLCRDGKVERLPDWK